MNITICATAVVILLSSVFMMFLKDKNLFLRFMNTLDNKQKQIYERIIQRKDYYYIFGGMLLGIFLGLLYLYYNKNQKEVYVYL